MTAADRAPTAQPTGIARPGSVARILVFGGTIITVIAIAVLPLLTPWFIHPGLDAAHAPARLGLDPAETRRMSDLSVQELVLGPGSFEFAGADGGAFYDESERSHLRDARLLLWLLLGLGAASVGGIAIALKRATGPGRAALWRAVAAGGAASAVGIIVLGLISIVAFSTVFSLFHQIFFPAGNYSFDPASQRLVQLYPFGFWQIAAAGLGVSVTIVGTATWLIGRTLARRGSRSSGDVRGHRAPERLDS